MSAAQFDVASCECPDPAVEQPHSTYANVRSPFGFESVPGVCIVTGLGALLPSSAERDTQDALRTARVPMSFIPSTERQRWNVYPTKIDRQHPRPTPMSRPAPTPAVRARPTRDRVGARSGTRRQLSDRHHARRSATSERRSETCKERLGVTRSTRA